MNEVTTLLEHSPIFEDVHQHDNENWNIALWNNCKKFVSHPYYQDFLRKRLYGEGDWDQHYFLKFCFIFLSLILPITYPFVIIFDSIFGKNDLVFLSPENHQLINPNQKENKMKAFYRSAMHRPIFRIYFHHFMEFIFLITLCLSSIDPNDTVNDFDLWWYDYLLGVFVICYVIDDFLEFFRRGWASLSSFWHMYYFCNHVFLLLGALMLYISATYLQTDNRQYLSGNHPANIGGTIFAFASLAALLRPLRWLLLHKTLGPVVICVIKVFKDVFYILVITLIMFVSMAIGSFTMLKPFELDKELCHSMQYES